MTHHELQQVSADVLDTLSKDLGIHKKPMTPEVVNKYTPKLNGCDTNFVTRRVIDIYNHRTYHSAY